MFYVDIILLIGHMVPVSLGTHKSPGRTLRTSSRVGLFRKKQPIAMESLLKHPLCTNERRDISSQYICFDVKQSSTPSVSPWDDISQIYQQSGSCSLSDKILNVGLFLFIYYNICFWLMFSSPELLLSFYILSVHSPVWSRMKKLWGCALLFNSWCTSLFFFWQSPILGR